jgi:hypothetical protein
MRTSRCLYALLPLCLGLMPTFAQKNNAVDDAAIIKTVNLTLIYNFCLID